MNPTGSGNNPNKGNRDKTGENPDEEGPGLTKKP